SSQQTSALKECSKLIEGANAKVKQPLLAAEVHRTVGLLYFNAPVKNPAKDARNQFQGAASRIEFEITDKNPCINEQMFLIELALSQIELGGEGDDVLANVNRKLPWDEVLPELTNTLNKIQTPEIRVIALREVGSRLVALKQMQMAVGLANRFSSAPAASERP